MSIIGSGAAMSVTKSHSPRSHTASMISSHAFLISSSLSRMRRGVNPLLTSLRRFQCSGSSMSIIMGMGPFTGRLPAAFENVSASFSAASTAAYDAMPQSPVWSSK